MRTGPAIARVARRLGRNESGATLVELALVIALFLLIFFGILDFGRMAFNFVATEKAMQMAARVAAVRPAVCTGVPVVHERGSNTVPEFGSSCGANTCATVQIDCRGDQAVTPEGIETINEIMGLVGPVLPNGANASHLRFHYQSDPALGFLGGPFTPIVTVEIDHTAGTDAPEDDLRFQFLGGLDGLARLAGGSGGFAGFNFPSFSMSLPGEDLARGTPE